MKLGAHLPIVDFDGTGFAPSELWEYVDAACDSGFSAISGRSS